MCVIQCCDVVVQVGCDFCEFGFFVCGECDQFGDYCEDVFDVVVQFLIDDFVFFICQFLFVDVGVCFELVCDLVIFSFVVVLDWQCLVQYLVIGVVEMFQLVFDIVWIVGCQ